MNEPQEPLSKPDMPENEARYRICQTDTIRPVPCSCGSSRRAFTDDADRVASLHIVETDGDAQTHYHRKMTEIYYFLEGAGQMELDGQLCEVRPGTAILIKPGCRHRAIGNLTFLNLPVPAFDPADEWFD